MTITKEIVLQTFEDICRKRDQPDPVSHPESAAQESTFERLRLDGNLDGLAHYVMVEINNAKSRGENNHYGTISKHQYVGILKTFVGPSAKAPDGEASLLPVIEAITDFMIISMRH